MAADCRSSRAASPSRGPAPLPSDDAHSRPCMTAARPQAARSSPARAASARRRSPPRSACWRPGAEGARSWWRSASRAACRRCSASSRPQPGIESPSCEDGLSSISIDPDRALLEWLQALGGRVSGRVLASSGTFSYFAAAAPGAKELVSMVKIWQLTRGGGRGSAAAAMTWSSRRARHRARAGHARLAAAPSARSPASGPIAGQTRQLLELLEDAAAHRLPGGGAGDRDGRHRGDRAAGGAASASWARAVGGDRQRAAAAALHGRGDGADRVARRRRQRPRRRWAPARPQTALPRAASCATPPCRRPARSTIAPASSTTSSRACAGGSSR